MIKIFILFFLAFNVAPTFASGNIRAREVNACQKHKAEFAKGAYEALKNVSSVFANFNSFTPYPDSTPKCNIGVSEDNRGYYCFGSCTFSDWEGTEVKIDIGEANWRRKDPQDKKWYFDVESINYVSTL